MERVAAHPQATYKYCLNLAIVYVMAEKNDAAAAAYAERGRTALEIAKKSALYKRIRALARAGKHTEILAYLQNGHDLDDPMVVDNLAEPTDPSADMASAMSDVHPRMTSAADECPLAIVKT